MIILIRAKFGRVILGHKTVSKKYDTLSTLIGAEALDVQNQENCTPELKSWVMGILATIFSNLDSLTTEDGDVIARIVKEVRVMTAARQQPTRPPQTVITPSSSSNAATIGAPYPTATQSEIPQIAGRKRKAVVIDLSGD